MGADRENVPQPQEICTMSVAQVSIEYACQYFLNKVLLLNAGDRLLVYIDRPAEELVVGELQARALCLGIETEILQLGHLSSSTEMVRVLCDRIASGEFNAICEMADQYFYLTPVWGQAMEEAARLYSVGAMDRAAFVRCVGQVDHARLAELGDALYQILRGARRVRLETGAGTSIRFRMNTGSLLGRIMSRLRLTAMSQVWRPTGTLKPGGGATFLGGQLSFLPIPHTIHGRAVIDGYLWPPDGIGCLEEPIVLEIERGQVVEIGGDTITSGLLRNWLSGKEKAVEHFCIGFNPGARLSNNLVEAERAFGHINIGFGAYPYHTDGVIGKPRLTIDGDVLMENNTFIDARIASLAAAL